jgi:hypothetical protein
MSTEQDQARLLAERIARRVSQGGGTEGTASQARAQSRGDVGHELAAVRESLAELQQRLSRLESHLTSNQSNAFQSRGSNQSSQVGEQRQTGAPAATQPATRSPWLSGVYFPVAHPSQERFGVEEAAVSELVDFFESEKKCEVEPGGKPCDHCAMCSTRGF